MTVSDAADARLLNDPAWLDNPGVATFIGPQAARYKRAWAKMFTRAKGDAARERVAHHKKRAPRQERARQQKPMIGADQTPHRMRNDQADETDRPADRHHARR